MTSNIRNFAIISHIDHGKSTLADRLMELTGLIPPPPSGQKTPRIDRMELEVERGVTIKLKAVRLPYTLDAKPHTLNMIDTPGHVDFSYEVSRSLAACEGALLLVDATQGPQAQTVAHLEKAKSLNLTVIGVTNKIDSRLAQVEETEEDMRRLGTEGEILQISALKGQGIEAIPKAIVERVPSHPQTVRVGDTAALINQLTKQPVAQLPGYKEPQSFVFASLFTQKEEFSNLKEALEKLRLEEPAVSVEETFSPALGRGFKLGFLGTFHLEIVKERLEREFNLDIVTTKPVVAFRGLSKEPWIRAAIITPPGYLSGVAKLIIDRRGKLGEVTKFGARMNLAAELPLAEFVKDFYDRLKSLSAGYASLDWEFIGYRTAKLAKLDIAVHGDAAEGLSEVVLKSQAQRIGREKVEKLKEVMPRKQFPYAIQARVGGKVLARADVPAMRKDVTGHLYGGDVTRKRKLLKKQKKGKKELAAKGRVEVPPEAFLV